MNFKIADINSKYFSVLQSSNFKHSNSYGSNFKCGKTGKDKGFIGYFNVQLVLITTLFLVTILTQAQDIPNNGFEEWTSGEPTYWNTLDQDVLGITFNMVTENNSDPYSGNSCVKMETISNYFFLYGDVVMPGLITLGEIESDPLTQEGGITGGVPYSQNPQSLSGYFKYFPQEVDTASIGLALFRWNGASRDTLAGGVFQVGEEVAEWTQFEATLEYVIWAQPDTLNILAASSSDEEGDALMEGSTLYLDELTLNYGPTSIIEPDFSGDFTVYPISTTQQFKIEMNLATT
ncbi:MAG: PCMD domain-containing protein, partial [Bacteroidota bacterium]|nr:PCMD domain-containing protein [Bacteroidota bacterium]